MQLVLLRDKRHPARQVDACEAAARAVVFLLDDPRTQPGGPWHDAVRQWSDKRIRKIVRRASGKRWDDVQALEGVTVSQDPPADGPVETSPARVRAFVPAPVRPQPKQIDKLQVAGTNLPADGVSATTNGVVTIEINPRIEMTTGKACAQCGHAAQLAYEAMSSGNDEDRHALDRWRRDEFRVHVVTPTVEHWDADVARVRVVDAGFTEFDGPTATTRARW
ncbi:peptidyl-tRNA hydrolase [Cutibacterium sp. WCA-380-WT-3A]|uniref:peptidyl-tRNA hydrolase n=1 Tax=Cutibacterium porci TaxID=2605781 RepID=A0A7K0J9Q9_9ACTN|nr:peptidyl-tRNA hydrolase [Cutibacterium porci]MSS46702.1 peptidyl-tRNA hydrolase [Cutibacterium porci]